MFQQEANWFDIDFIEKNRKKFWNVIPFLGALKSWIAKNREKSSPVVVVHSEESKGENKSQSQPPLLPTPPPPGPVYYPTSGTPYVMMGLPQPQPPQPFVTPPTSCFAGVPIVQPTFVFYPPNPFGFQ